MFIHRMFPQYIFLFLFFNLIPTLRICRPKTLPIVSNFFFSTLVFFASDGVCHSNLVAPPSSTRVIFQVILQVPSSTPSPSYFWQTGMLELRFEVIKRKLNFVNSLKSLDGSSLAKQIFNEQVKHQWPGLVMECDELCDSLNLPRISLNLSLIHI